MYQEIRSGSFYTNGALGKMRINDSNQVAGELVGNTFARDVFIWDAENGFTNLTEGMGLEFYCNGINNLGQVFITGLFSDDSSSYISEFIWDPDDGMVEIGKQLTGQTDAYAAGFSVFNDQGWILNNGWNGNEWVILKPIITPEPGGIVALTAGLAAFAGFLRRRAR